MNINQPSPGIYGEIRERIRLSQIAPNPYYLTIYCGSLIVSGEVMSFPKYQTIVIKAAKESNPNHVIDNQQLYADMQAGYQDSMKRIQDGTATPEVIVLHNATIKVGETTHIEEFWIGNIGSIDGYTEVPTLLSHPK